MNAIPSPQKVQDAILCNNMSATLSICRAFIAVKAANHELAISLFREVLEICESKEEASVLLTNISLLYHQNKDWDQALAYAEKVCTQ